MAAFERENWIRAACLLEATARKPGNVHPGASFSDLTYADFVESSEVVAPIIARAADMGVGETIYRAALATRKQVGTNSNLGILFMLAPLAAVPRDEELEPGVRRVLEGLTRDDARWVYQAIALAEPGGMGKVSEGDVSSGPTGTLLEMMQLAAERDRIASEYSSGFAITFNFGVPFLATCREFKTRWEPAIIELQLRLMATYPDTLIARKCGGDIAEESARRAREVLSAGPLCLPEASQKLEAFDRWLREEGHKRNPGTTADLIAGALFAAMRMGLIEAPHPEGL